MIAEVVKFDSDRRMDIRRARPERGRSTELRELAMIRHINAAAIGLMAFALWSSACAPISPRRVATGPAEFQEPAQSNLPDAEISALVAAHNRRRALAKRPPITINAKLSAAALVQAKDMAEHSKMSHSGGDGSTPFQRIERQGYRFRNAGENVAYGQEDVDAVMTSWMESPPHKKNILGDFSEMGAAKALDKDGVPYWCVDFGRPWPTVAPETAADDVLKAINAARADAKLPALVLSPILAEAASKHAKFMAEKGALDAKEDDGKTPIQRLADQNRFRSLSEGDASGAAKGEDLVKGWLDDRGQLRICWASSMRSASAMPRPPTAHRTGR